MTYSGAQKTPFKFPFFSCISLEKYVDIAINDFTKHPIISKWLKRQKCKQKRKTMRTKDVETKEEIVDESVFIHLNI